MINKKGNKKLSCFFRHGTKQDLSYGTDGLFKWAVYDSRWFEASLALKKSTQAILKVSLRGAPGALHFRGCIWVEEPLATHGVDRSTTFTPVKWKKRRNGLVKIGKCEELKLGVMF